MKIIILGAGQVGSTLAESLAQENNDITIIDNEFKAIKKLEETLDIRTIVGNASYPNLLLRAGAEEADLLIAVTNNDETNMVACQIAHTLFQIPTKIARIRSLQYQAYESLFDTQAIPVDVIISPEQLVTNHIRKLVEHPNALQIYDFADQKIHLVLAKAKLGGPMVGHKIKKLEYNLPDTEVKIVSIFRKGIPIIPDRNTHIEEDDEVFFITASENSKKVLAELHPSTKSNNKIIIAGGGNVGTRLALSLENNFNVKIIDRNTKHVQYLSTHVKKATVLQGDITDNNLLYNENIENTDIFCAVTNNDESNIMGSLLAKYMGAKKTITLVNKPIYVDTMQKSSIDNFISPQQSTIGSLLTYIRKGDVVKVHSLRKGTTEALEGIVHGNKNTSKVVGKKVKDLKLPKGTIVSAIARGLEIIIHNIEETIIKTGDHIIIFMTDKKDISKVEKLFHVEKISF